ncbi:YajG family lipoprotein [Mariprofundus sp. KV]|uniref:YajG family lipoprotein n=1 Tax=Mariprofundus sp. KV TaxID=2608715 RepID=UPI0015A3F15C|nr:YajG family lipoprotein [Mariprofundus sp. KV]NWF35934.1 hypothetical protein [Mariprofundus sp. KV]
MYYMKSAAIVIMLLAVPAAVSAGEIKTEIFYPSAITAIAESAGEIGLWVEDGRAEKVLGRAVDGEYLVPASDIATSLYAHMASSLKEGGYRVVPYSSEMANGLLIRIHAINYAATREMIKSKVEVKVALEAKMNVSTISRTYRASVEEQFALSPSGKENGTIIGSALTTAAASVLADIQLTNATQPEGENAEH